MSAEIIRLQDRSRICPECEGHGAFSTPTFTDETCTEVASITISACKKCRGSGKVATKPAIDPWVGMWGMP